MNSIDHPATCTTGTLPGSNSAVDAGADVSTNVGAKTGPVIPATPWRAGGTRNSDIGPHGQPNRFIRDATGAVIACASEGTMEEAKAIAARIVASVNACAGFTLEQLEGGLCNQAEMDALRAKVDDMLQALATAPCELDATTEMETWTVFIREVDGTGTTYISSGTGTKEAVVADVKVECSQSWECDEDRLHVLGVARGDVAIDEWED